jgi:2'-5' RNA ligase
MIVNMRVFFAIEFEEEIKERLYSLQQEIKKYCSGGNFSHKENFHLTLRFIGEQNPGQVEKLRRALRTAAAGTPCFQLQIDRLGAFSKGNKKIIWTGLEENNELQKLYCRLEAALEREGYFCEGRSYSPHITLVRETRPAENAPGIDKIQLDKSAVKVSSISLMESKRVNDRLTYTAIDKAGLQGY